MKKSLLILCSLAAAAAVAAVSACRNVVEVAVVRLTEVAYVIKCVVSAAVEYMAGAWRELVRNLPGPAVQLLVAKVYQLRQVKRDRPVMSASWRMCPSG